MANMVLIFVAYLPLVMTAQETGLRLTVTEDAIELIRFVNVEFPKMIHDQKVGILAKIKKWNLPEDVFRNREKIAKLRIDLGKALINGVAHETDALNWIYVNQFKRLLIEAKSKFKKHSNSEIKQIYINKKIDQFKDHLTELLETYPFEEQICACDPRI